MKNDKVNKALAVVGIIIGAIYILNPTAGLLELIPDIAPVIGNLDEAGATALVLWGIQALRQPSGTPLSLPDARTGASLPSAASKTPRDR
jgi:uncharacterized membrane protein YkvA (DUF1232 family)